MKLNEKLVSLRKEKKLTQLQVAEALDVSRQAISRWESGAAAPSADNLRSLSELYGVSVDSLLNQERWQPVPAEQEKIREKKRRPWLPWLTGILIGILIAAAAAGVIYICMTRQNSKAWRFDEVPSVQWDEENEKNFSLDW